MVMVGISSTSESAAAFCWLYSPFTARKISADRTVTLPEMSSGFPKSASDSTKRSRKEPAKPGISNGRVMVRKM